MCRETGIGTDGALLPDGIFAWLKQEFKETLRLKLPGRIKTELCVKLKEYQKIIEF